VDSRPFLDGFRQLKDGFVRLLESISALSALSGLRIAGQPERMLLDEALEILMLNQDLERCSVFMREGGRFVNAAGRDWADLVGLDEPGTAPRATTVFALGEGLVGIAGLTGALQHCRDASLDPRVSMPDGRRPSGAILSVPIRAGSEVLGVLNVSHPYTHFFNESHERTLLVFCNFLAQILVNNRMVSGMDELVRTRTQQLESALAEAQELRRRFEQLAIIDDLTGLYNRRFFFPEARTALGQAIRHGHPFTALIADVDHFKRVNDSLGHAAGDTVLVAIADLFRGAVREGDILARFGGEEFVVALPHTDVQGAMVFAERLRRSTLEREWTAEGRRLEVTLSIGVAALAGRGGDTGVLLDQILSEADQALYAGKQAGRNRSCLYGEAAAGQPA
jgi:diguanylate cyclase (GGDEF)-like protein